MKSNPFIFLHNHGQTFLIRKRTILNKLNPNTASQIFDTMVFPILKYNSEVWGMYSTYPLIRTCI